MAIAKSKNSERALIKKSLNNKMKEELINIVLDLYSISKENKDFLGVKLLQSSDALESYREEIKTYLAPDRPWDNEISISKAKKAISNFRKASNNPIGLIDLMVYYVECGTEFLCEYGDMYEQYYMSLESVFENVLKKLKVYEVDQIADFIARLEKVVRKAYDMGWGYYDNISYMLNNAYGDVTV
ncbi:hypothetical protein L3V82_12785 [Thiotrichales bacterium 19S3-7]|nr:hypothetical protein [Thiotrichales bacterium 19S3-7]MCF6803050.1 hypothetical protein [Thiotrichales bacterium 19S3-11]